MENRVIENKGPLTENWLAEAIIVTIMCCMPVGIVAIVKASEINAKVARQDFDGAEEERKAAKK